jgi:hypothetical protein
MKEKIRLQGSQVHKLKSRKIYVQVSFVKGGWPELSLRLSPRRSATIILVVAVPLNVHSVSPELYRNGYYKTPKSMQYLLQVARRRRIKSAENRERNCSACSICGHLMFLGAFKKYHQHASACILPLEERGEHRYKGWCVCEQCQQTRQLKLRAFKHLRDYDCPGTQDYS